MWFDCVHVLSRSETPLIYKAVPSWFVRVEQATTQLLENNQKTYWSVLLSNRFQLWLNVHHFSCMLLYGRNVSILYIYPLMHCKLGISKYLCGVKMFQFDNSEKFTIILIPCFIINEILNFFLNAFSFAGCLILWKRRDLLTGCERHVIGRYLVTDTGGHQFPSGSAKMVKRWGKRRIIWGSTK